MLIVLPLVTGLYDTLIVLLNIKLHSLQTEEKKKH